MMDGFGGMLAADDGVTCPFNDGAGLQAARSRAKARRKEYFFGLEFNIVYLPLTNSVGARDNLHPIQYSGNEKLSLRLALKYSCRLGFGRMGKLFKARITQPSAQLTNYAIPCSQAVCDRRFLRDFSQQSYPTIDHSRPPVISDRRSLSASPGLSLSTAAWLAGTARSSLRNSR